MADYLDLIENYTQHLSVYSTTMYVIYTATLVLVLIAGGVFLYGGIKRHSVISIVFSSIGIAVMIVGVFKPVLFVAGSIIIIVLGFIPDNPVRGSIIWSILLIILMLVSIINFGMICKEYKNSVPGAVNSDINKDKNVSKSGLTTDEDDNMTHSKDDTVSNEKREKINDRSYDNSSKDDKYSLINQASFDITSDKRQTINLKSDGSGDEHYAVVKYALTVYKSSKAYDDYSESLNSSSSSAKSLVKQTVEQVISKHTYSEMQNDHQEISDECTTAVASLFEKDFIHGIVFESIVVK